MKTSILKYLTAACIIFSGFTASAQLTSETVSIGANYTNQTFYSFSNGTVASVSNTDWDLGLQLRGFAASILINSKNNVRLFTANKAAAEWNTMPASDTTGIIGNTAYELFNSDTSWDFGAFNTTNDASNMFDLGWGLYDFSTHAIVGDSVYYIMLSNGDVKKFMLESLISGIYNFRWADPDGTNEITAAVDKSIYLGKFFVYYSLTNNMVIDREPVYNAWDLSFAQYMTLTPFTYKVTGVLANDSVRAVKAYPVDISSVFANGLTFHDEINTIGYDWKTFDMNTFTWTIADSTVYFVEDRQGAVWKMIFTGFGGSANGEFYFDQEMVGTAGIFSASQVYPAEIYPNPASGTQAVIVIKGTPGAADLTITDMNGRNIYTSSLELDGSVERVGVNIDGLIPGLYLVNVSQDYINHTAKLLVR